MEKLLVAKVLKPQGIKGELKCQLYTDVLQAVTQAKKMHTDSGECEIEKTRIHDGFLFVKFLGVNDRNNAEIFRGQNLYLPKEDLAKHNKTKFLVDDLIGMVLYDKNGNLVGQIVDYEDYGSAPILSIDENGHVYEVPYIQSIFFPQNGTLVVERKGYEANKI